ncbi:MAG: TusE/DsrC/DsvC family sulfur relay protein, partial [Thiobacillus sp.]|nr:TusE/DsrC/DsvC family sulfur relay protein [Thiobacillus sp.]
MSTKTLEEMIMEHVSTDINKLIQEPATDPDFPCAPFEWTRDEAKRSASEEGLELTDEHWEVIRALQRYYAQHENNA